MKALLETGVHFGHRTRKWNPKMKPYIFTQRNGIHILDLHQTLKAIKDSYEVVRDAVTNGGSLLFVGTKRQAQDTMMREAQRCNMAYVSERWLGGTLTNWRTIRQRIDYLKGLEARRDRGEFELLTKKEGLMLTREIERLNERLGGIREMRGLPALLFVVDVRREHTAIHEASTLNIPVIAMVDTNSDPDNIDYVIPANDDAIRAIKLVASVMADAVLEGVAMRKDSGLDEEVEDVQAGYDYRGAEPEDEERSDEEFLGEATLAKLKSGSLSFGEVEGDDDLAVDMAAVEEMDVLDSDIVSEEEPASEEEAPAPEGDEAGGE
jgi:small subunit ribosomal protein S2